MKLEKAIKECETFIKCIRTDLKEECKDNFILAEAIETVVYEFKKLQQKEKSRTIGRIDEIKMEDLESILKPYYISKKKIKKLKSEYERKYKKHKSIADKHFKEIGTRDCFDKELAIRDLGAIRTCEKLLEEK